MTVASICSEVCRLACRLVCQSASLAVGISPAGVVASLPVVSCWRFGIFQDAVVGVTSQASYHHVSKSRVVC